MDRDLSGWAAATGVLISLLLLGVGFGMWHDAPTPADSAVGKGLLTLGACSTLITLLLAAISISAAPSALSPVDQNRRDGD